MRDFGFEWGDYVSVAEKRRQAEKELAKLRKRGHAAAPVIVQGRKIANNFWGLSWCSNLERYSDFANRLPRGRSYVRNGCVIDLQIEKGRIAAKVSGSDLYDVAITIAPVTAKRWRAICGDCTGSIDSLVELLQGRLAGRVMDRVCREGDGLFPAPGEIKLSCSCPDSADMCKHVAATLYAIGARLDMNPELLFVLRAADHHELITEVTTSITTDVSTPVDGSAMLAGESLEAMFGIEIEPAPLQAPRATASKSPKSRSTGHAHVSETNAQGRRRRKKSKA